MMAEYSLGVRASHPSLAAEMLLKSAIEEARAFVATVDPAIHSNLVRIQTQLPEKAIAAFIDDVDAAIKNIQNVIDKQDKFESAQIKSLLSELRRSVILMLHALSAANYEKDSFYRTERLFRLGEIGTTLEDPKNIVEDKFSDIQDRLEVFRKERERLPELKRRHSDSAIKPPKNKASTEKKRHHSAPATITTTRENPTAESTVAPDEGVKTDKSKNKSFFSKLKAGLAAVVNFGYAYSAPLKNVEKSLKKIPGKLGGAKWGGTNTGVTIALSSKAKNKVIKKIDRKMAKINRDIEPLKRAGSTKNLQGLTSVAKNSLFMRGGEMSQSLITEFVVADQRLTVVIRGKVGTPKSRDLSSVEVDELMPLFVAAKDKLDLIEKNKYILPDEKATLKTDFERKIQELAGNVFGDGTSIRRSQRR